MPCWQSPLVSKSFLDVVDFLLMLTFVAGSFAELSLVFLRYVLLSVSSFSWVTWVNNAGSGWVVFLSSCVVAWIGETNAVNRILRVRSQHKPGLPPKTSPRVLVLGRRICNVKP